ncbi:hypothetical protein [Sphingomonas hankyongi]|uniref:Uncharacterized protein n=1 Tax=Sphingomonas hankyongi TaxID=2908209 RepID=A0ABT0S447_9SPHN|nr:hypothetical protein [Sphingomonas hankyongi]MCL6730325.1 hypothetical protein [Sphingomonas hankyongi]
MPMTAERVVELCRQNAAVVREDIALMEAGRLKFQALGSDATREQIARMKANLSRLQEIIDACGCDCA